MKIRIAAGLAGLLASGIAWGEGPEGRDGTHRGGAQKRAGGPEKRDFFSDMLARSDKDGNGGINFVEFAAGDRISGLPEEHQKRLFERLDKNGDGEIRREDIGRPGGPGRGAPDRGSKPRGPHDPNRDGRVSLEEFRTSPRVADLEPDRQKELFTKMDRNGDGFLDRKDFQGRRPGRDGGGSSRMMTELDTNKDGEVSFEEFRAGPRAKDFDEDEAKDMFERMDRNQDGKLRPDEFRGERRGPGMGAGDAGAPQRQRGTGPQGGGRGKDSRGKDSREKDGRPPHAPRPVPAEEEKP